MSMSHIIEEQLILRQENPEYCKRRKSYCNYYYSTYLHHCMYKIMNIHAAVHKGFTKLHFIHIHIKFPLVCNPIPKFMYRTLS